jgi:isoleucyl-tRNA synthetase
MKDYKQTLNLPRTNFPMRANLAQREPEFLKFWEKIDLYNRLMKKNENSPQYILHDGPPYANGDIHLGHALNKTLKDIVIRYKFLTGYKAPYVPGWDCHGLPVEHQLFKELGLKKSEVDPVDFRKKAKDYALHFVNVQREQFKRLGVIGDWNNPYLTLQPEYEYHILKALAELIRKGYLYKDVKPVNWCIHCETALAEAEVEYNQHISDSIYVKFKLDPDSHLREEFSLPQDTYFLIWTTTPWTLISNTAIALSPEEEYIFVKTRENEVLIFANELKEKLQQALKIEFGPEIASRKGKALEGETALHPFFPRKSQVVSADFVSMEEGTGCVHIAPGHGEEDYQLGKEKNLQLIQPINDQGIFENVGEFSGLDVWSANEKVKKVLDEKGLLLHSDKISHSYPHCWRCKSPIIFRATAQWFMSVDKNNLRQLLIQEAKNVNWVPPTGLQRITGMLEIRPDWCLSRQRYWGVAIPSFKCKKCGESILDEKVVKNVAEEVKKHGSDVWFTADLAKFLPSGYKCPECGNSEIDNFEKETDIIDVWFESGVSYFAVLNSRYGLRYPSDLYLEGSDQHRGWFQTSLITAVAITGQAPYRNVVTHGFVVDGEGRKMSKSLGNVISPFEVIEKYGADVLRLWVVSRDFSQDLRISNEILSQVVEAYRKIRNTFRFLVSNLYDFDPRKEAVPYQDMDVIDKWIYSEFNLLAKELISAYERYDFHTVYRKIYLFMNETLSSIYLDILKDRLYTLHPQSRVRKSSQTMLYRLASELAKFIAPILPFTAEDVWRNIENKDNGHFQIETVHLATIEPSDFEFLDQRILNDFRRLLEIRELVMKALERQREADVIGSSLEAEIEINISMDKLYEFLDNYKSILNTFFIVSNVRIGKKDDLENPYKLETGEELEIIVKKSGGKKCNRCWNYTYDVGNDKEFEDVCSRCAQVLRRIK